MRHTESALLRGISIWSVALLAVLYSSVVAGTSSDKNVYQDPNEPFERRVQDLLSRMTMEETLSQMMSRTPSVLNATTRLTGQVCLVAIRFVAILVSQSMKGKHLNPP